MNREAHTLFFLRHLRQFPQPYESQDINRVVIMFFCVQGLAVLDELKQIDPMMKKHLIEFIYSLQVHPDCRDKSINITQCGFRGSPWIGNAFFNGPREYESTTYDSAHIASTYAALAILRTLGDDLTRVNKEAIVKALKLLQDTQIGR